MNCQIQVHNRSSCPWKGIKNSMSSSIVVHNFSQSWILSFPQTENCLAWVWLPFIRYIINLSVFPRASNNWILFCSISEEVILRSFSSRYTKYTITSLEKAYKPKLFVEPDLGIPLDLLDLSVYKYHSWQFWITKILSVFCGIVKIWGCLFLLQLVLLVLGLPLIQKMRNYCAMMRQ